MEHGLLLTTSADTWRSLTKELRQWQFRSSIWAGFDFNGESLVLPYWFLLFLSAALGALPFLNRMRRFSLRTLLIAMTAAAIGLGWIAYQMRD
jgi:hypothetical protein